MSAAVALISLFTLIFAFAGYMAAVTGGDYPANPLKWRSERHRRLETARVQRVSALEHDLGYVPCSYEDCSICKRLIVMNTADGPYNYFMKQVFDKETLYKKAKWVKGGTVSGGPR